MEGCARYCAIFIAFVGSASTAGPADATLPAGERKVLIAIAQYQARGGIRRDALTVLTGYKKTSRDAYIQRLRQRGYLDTSGDRLLATSSGIAALGDAYDPLPTGPALRERVLRDLPDGERKILEVLIACYPAAAARSDIDIATGYKKTSRDAYIQRLTRRRLAMPVGAGLV